MALVPGAGHPPNSTSTQEQDSQEETKGKGKAGAREESERTQGLQGRGPDRGWEPPSFTPSPAPLKQSVG